MSGSDPLVTKHIINWTPEDVSVWVGSLGSWAKGDYELRFLDAGIDGSVLLELSEHDLQEPPLSVTVSYHRKAILNGLHALMTHGAKAPADFWEYKVRFLI